MPIIETPGDTLSQGDIFENVEVSFTESAGQFLPAPSKLVMVVSRPCNLAHKKLVTVGLIKKVSETPPTDLKSFSDVKDYLDATRDGTDTPNRFYLGQLPNRDGRHFLNLDALFTVSKNYLVAEKKIGSLNREFLCDFQIRFFVAFTKQGFDDHSWMSTDDLDWLIVAGEAEIADKRRALQGDRAGGSGGNYEKRQEKIDTLESTIAVYKKERATRD